MAEEPQPDNIHEGADDHPLPATGSAEDRKAAAALSSLDRRGDDDDDDASKRKGKEVDAEALGKAMQNLDVGGGGTKGGERKGGEGKQEVKEAKKVVKVDQADVGLLVEELELSKIKATELLKAHEGNAVKAMAAYVTTFA